MTVPEHVFKSADGAALRCLTLGRGEPLLVLGGVLRTAHDYLPLAEELASDFQVHIVHRRGRGGSAPQGPDYAMEKECEDVAAAVVATGAERVFGHSYGGLIALRAASQRPELKRLAVYEPGVSVCGSIPLGWIPDYRRLLEAGDRRGAFACLARGSGHAPSLFGRLPLPWSKALLRVAVPPGDWRRMNELLEPTLREHEEIARLDGHLEDYRAVTAEVLLLAGGESPDASTAALHALARTLPRTALRSLPGLSHQGPEKAPATVAAAVRAFMLAPSTAMTS